MKILEKVKADKTNKIAVTGLVLVSSYLSLIPNTGKTLQKIKPGKDPPRLPQHPDSGDLIFDC